MNNSNKNGNFYEKIELETILMQNLKITSFSTSDFKEKAYMFIYVVNGNMSFYDPKFSYLGEVFMSPGSCAMLAPDTNLHHVKTQNCDLRGIIASPEILKRCCDFLSPELFSMLTEKEINLCSIPFENMFCLENMCEQFINCIWPEVQVQFSKNVLFLVLHHFLSTNSDKYSNYPTIVKKILSILNFMQNIMDGIPPSIYELGYSKSYICRIFKKHVGMSITNYITDMKLKHSILILNTRILSIEELCEELHFQSVSYFTKIFKKKFGITPAKYRNQIKKNKQLSNT